MSTLKIEIPLKLAKSTGGTHVYANEEQGFKGIYVPKDFFPKGSKAPEYLNLTLEEPA